MPNFSAFLSYILLMSFTPGPNNIMAMSIASRYGFKRGVRFCLGVFLGCMLVISGCTALSSMLYHLIPRIEPVMVFIGAAYILWLAWSIYHGEPHESKGTAAIGNGVLSAIVFQFLNVKGFLYGITATSTFILPYYRDPPTLILFVMLMSLTAMISTVCWSVFGAVFERIFKKHGKILNAVMALLLIYCAAALVIEYML